MTEAFRLGFMAKIAELQKESQQLLRLSDSEALQKVQDYTESDEWKSKASDPAFWTETTRLGEQGAAARRAAGGTQQSGSRAVQQRPGEPYITRPGAPPYSRPGTPVPLDPVTLGRKGPGGYEKNPKPYTLPSGVGTKPLTQEQREAESRSFEEKWKDNPTIKWHSRREYDEGLNPTGTAPLQPAARPAARPAVRPAAQPATRPAAQPAARPAAQPAARPAVRPAAQPAARPAVRPATQPAARPAAQPAARPAAQPAVRPATQPATRPAAQPRKFKVVYDKKTGTYRRADPNDTTPFTDSERRGIEKLHSERGRTTPISW